MQPKIKRAMSFLIINDGNDQEEWFAKNYNAYESLLVEILELILCFGMLVGKQKQFKATEKLSKSG